MTQQRTIIDLPDPLIGKTVAGYKILEVLGQGGMGIVYKAEDTGLERLAALKTLIPALAKDTMLLETFRREARTLARLHDRNIVTVYSLADVPGIGKFIVMEYVEGETLGERIRRQGAIPWAEALPLFKQLLSALAKAHDAGIIHRDIKPGNVMITPQGVVKVTDFGLAKIYQGGDQTRTEGIAGTLKYMAPEQKAGLAFTDARSDVYSLGMTLYETLVGRTPFDSGDGAFTARIPQPHLANPAIPKAFSSFLMKALETEPGKRYAHAGEMLQEVEAFEVQQDGKKERIRLPAPWVTGLLVGMLLLLIVAGYLLFPRPTLLSVSTVPSGAGIFLEGRNAGVTPLERLEIEPGMVALRLEKPGFAPFDTTFFVSDGRSITLNEIRLTGESNPPALHVGSLPVGARVLVDGAFVGTTPISVPVEDSAGSMLPVRVELAGHVPVDTVLVRGQDNQFSLRLALEKVNTPSQDLPPPVSRDKGTLVLRAVPSGSLQLDGKRVQSDAHSVSAGAHTVICGEAGYRAETSVRVSSGQTVTLNCYLEGTLNVSTAWAGQQQGIAPSASIRINDNSEGSSPTSLSRGPGTYRIAAGFLPGQPYEVAGGQYIIKNERNETKKTVRFEGNSYTLEARPSFDRERHLVSFLVREKAAAAY